MKSEQLKNLAKDLATNTMVSLPAPKYTEEEVTT